MEHKIFLLYDGTSNSVFHGQVLVPLKKQLLKNPDLRVTLVTFERDSSICSQSVSDRINIIVLKKLPFFGEASLWPAVYRFKKVYKKLYDTIGVNELVARGPFAGWIARKSIGSKRMPDRLVIQARGLAAEEFRYTHRSQEKYPKLLKKILYKLYNQIEFEAYSNFGFPEIVHIDAVSPALKEYLEKNFYTDPKSIVVSYQDIPECVPREQALKWRKEVREELSIGSDSHVCCYAGSAHAWQGIDDMIDYFVKQYEKNKNSVFLIVSQDENVFRKKLKLLKKGCYRIKSVPHSLVARYLSAGDVGLLFRDADPVNWVSRPTKMLEYQSVGLKVVHNDNVAWLCNNY
jgi:hypothetical protein